MSESSGSNSSSAPQVAIDTASLAPSQEVQTPQVAEVKKYKVKVDGQEQEVLEQDLIAGYQTRQASDKAFREAAQLRKQSEEFVRLLKEDPIKVLTNPKIGHDVRKLAEEYLISQMEEEMLDPKDRELRDAKAQLKAIEEEKNAQKAQEEELRAQELRTKYSQNYQKSIITALNTSGLPQTEETVKKMAYYMHQGLKRGMELEAIDVVDLVKDDYVKAQKSLYSGLDGDALVAILGDDIASKIRKHDIAKLKNPKQSVSTSQNSNTSKPSQSTKKMTKEDWKVKMQRIKDGLED